MPQPANHARGPGLALLYSYVMVALIAFLMGWQALCGIIFNVVTYRAIPLNAPSNLWTHLPFAVAVFAFARSACLRWNAIRSSSSGTTESLHVAHICWPVLTAIAATWLAIEPHFLAACMFIVSFGASIVCLTPARRDNQPSPETPDLNSPDGSAAKRDGSTWLVSLVALIVLSTVWHAMTQVEFWHRFMLGYADIGLFVTELEHCLPWREASARFGDTRMGYHCIPMFYVLAPFYALVRSPVFLMVVGPLLLNSAAVPFYFAMRKLSGSSTQAFLLACTWLLLPSISRLPYAGTYGFQSIYLAVPFLAWTWCLAFQGRWFASHVCLVLAMLCEETVCGVALGWGVYLAIFANRRRDGLVIALSAVGYLLLCTQVVIPYFTATMTYTRLKLFGDVDAAEFAGRLVRPEVFYYLLALCAPLAVGLWRRANLLVVILPTLALVLLLRDEQYLNIKYWHQSSMLPLLFCAALLGVVGRGAGQQARPSGRVLGMFVSAILFHQVFGFSPLSQAHRLHVASRPAIGKDARTKVVEAIHEMFVPSIYDVMVSERLAAHFWRYDALYPLAAIDSFGDQPWPRLLVIDLSDRWDPVLRAGRFEAVAEEARRRGFSVEARAGSIVVMERWP